MDRHAISRAIRGSKRPCSSRSTRCGRRAGQLRRPRGHAEPRSARGRGLRFTFAHAHAVMTLPSHASILTGRYPFEHGVRDNAGFRLDDKAETLAEIARKRRPGDRRVRRRVSARPAVRPRAGIRRLRRPRRARGRAGRLRLHRAARRRGRRARRAPGSTQQQGKWFAWVHVFDPHSPLRAAARRSTRSTAATRTPVKSRTSITRSARCSMPSAALAGPPPSSSPRITAKGSATTAKPRTACSRTNRPCGCR